MRKCIQNPIESSLQEYAITGYGNYFVITNLKNSHGETISFVFSGLLFSLYKMGAYQTVSWLVDNLSHGSMGSASSTIAFTYCYLLFYEILMYIRKCRYTRCGRITSHILKFEKRDSCKCYSKIYFNVL